MVSATEVFRTLISTHIRQHILKHRYREDIGAFIVYDDVNSNINDFIRKTQLSIHDFVVPVLYELIAFVCHYLII